MKQKRLLAILVSVLVAVSMMPLTALAGTEETLPPPTNVKAKVTKMEEGTMQTYEGTGPELKGTIATVEVQFDKSSGADAYWLAAVRRNAPGNNTVTFEKMLTGNMPVIKAKPGEKAGWETFAGGVTQTGPNGEKITETEKTMNVVLKVCRIDKPTGNTSAVEGCYKKGENIVLLLQAERGQYEDYVASRQIEMEVPFETNVSKKANTLDVKKRGKIIVVKSKKLKKKSYTIKRAKFCEVSKNQGDVTYAKKSGSKRITINKKTGNVTLKKKTKPGIYKVRVAVTAAGNKNYKKMTKEVVITVKVKK